MWVYIKREMISRQVKKKGQLLCNSLVGLRKIINNKKNITLKLLCLNQLQCPFLQPKMKDFLKMRTTKPFCPLASMVFVQVCALRENTNVSLKAWGDVFKNATIKTGGSVPQQQTKDAGDPQQSCPQHLFVV